MSEEGRRLASVSEFHWGLVDKLLGSYLISAILFCTCNDEFSRSLTTHLAGISIDFQCAHMHRGHTHSGPQQVMWFGICHCFFLYMNSETAVQSVLHHCFADILELPVDNTCFSTRKCVTVVYAFVALRHFCTRLSVKLIPIRSMGIFLSWAAQFWVAGFFFYSFWVPKGTFYSSSVPRNTFILHICIY